MNHFFLRAHKCCLTCTVLRIPVQYEVILIGFFTLHKNWERGPLAIPLVDFHQSAGLADVVPQITLVTPHVKALFHVSYIILSRGIFCLFHVSQHCLYVIAQYAREERTNIWCWLKQSYLLVEA